MNNTIRKEGSIDAIKTAITSLNQQGKKVTQQTVAELTKGTVSISTIRRHWIEFTSNNSKKISPIIIEPKKISSTPKKISSAPEKISSNPKNIILGFERFKRRAINTPNTFNPFTIDML